MGDLVKNGQNQSYILGGGRRFEDLVKNVETILVNNSLGGDQGLCVSKFGSNSRYTKGTPNS